MNIKTTNILRGIAAVVILFCHMQFKYNIFHTLGYLAVGVFFFFSGYNLCYSYLNKSESGKEFLIKKIKRIYLPFVISNLFFLICGHNVGFYKAIKYILGIEVYDGTLWYVYAIMSIYAVYYILSLLMKKCSKKHPVILGVEIWLVNAIGYLSIAVNLNLPTGINEIIPASFILGWMFYVKEGRIKKLISGKILLLIVGIILVLGLHYIAVGRICDSIYIWRVAHIGAPVMSALVCYYIGINYNFTSKILGVIGSVSYEIYLFHKGFINMYSDLNFSTWIYVLLCALSTIIVAFIVHKFCARLNS